MKNKLKIKSRVSYNFFLLGTIFIVACANNEDAVHPQKMPLTEAVYASGNVKAYNQYSVYSSFSGILKSKFVEENDLVSIGQVIAEIDNEQSAYQLDGSEAAFIEAKINTGENSPPLQQLETEIESAKLKLQNDSVTRVRFYNLLENKTCTRAEYEAKELQYITSKNHYRELLLKKADLQNTLHTKYKSALSSFKTSSANKNQRTVQSMINGRVYAFYKKQGELIQANEPLAIIGDKNKFVLELEVDELDINKVKIGQQVLVTLDTYGEQLFKATITKTSPYLDKRSKTFIVDAVFTDVPPNLCPGLTVEANIIVREKPEALVIPKSYLLPGDSVMLQNKEKIKVKTGLKNLKYVEIVSGLDTTATLYKK